MSNRVLVFPGEDALLAALTSELIPTAVQTRKVVFWRDDSGTVFVRPARRLPRTVRDRLRSAGVGESAIDPPPEATEAHVWPRIIAPRRQPDDEMAFAGQTVLLRITGDSPRTLVDVAAELLRLGCDRCAYQMLTRSGADETEASAERDPSTSAPTPELALLRVFEPPYYTVAASTERDAAYRAFVPVRSGDTRTWIQLGYSHPLAQAFVPPTGDIGLISADGSWHTFADGPWHDIFDIVDINLPAGSRTFVPIAPPRRLEIRLRLTSATRTEAPSLWVVRGADPESAGLATADETSAIDHIDSLVGSLPDDIIGRLLFAVVGAPEDPVVVLRARHGRAGPPSLDVPGVALVPLAGLSNLFVPRDAMLEPPLRRDTVRDLLAPDDERVYWLAPLANRLFRVESAPDRSFAPLADWIDYLIDRSAEELEPWVRSVTFEFDAFQSIGTEWSAGPPPARKPEKEPTRSKKPLQLASPTPSTVPYAALEAANEMLDVEAQLSEQAQEAPEPIPQRELSALEADLAHLERAFLDSEATADSPERNQMWLDMARLLVPLGRHRDASLCHARALWELPPAQSADICREWARAEGIAVDDQQPDSLLWLPVRVPEATATIEPAQVRAVAVHWIASVLAGLDIEPLPSDDTGAPMRRSHALQLVQAWLDAHDRTLDVRTLWLLRWALADHSGGDPLALARARDRILQGLHTGLSLERDVPTFLRFLDRQGGGDSVVAAHLSEGLESLTGLLDRTKRQRSSIEAPTNLTRSYVWLSIAYGFARLGQAQRANELREQAAESLDLSDPVHGYLHQAYSARIDQALQGQPPEAPFPAHIARNLSELVDGQNSGQLTRYCVDRLRQASEILEPQARVDAFSGFLSRRREDGVDELAGLVGLPPAELVVKVERLLTTATADGTPVDRKADLFDDLMDFFPMLPSAWAVPALRNIVQSSADVPPPRRAQLLEEALMLAGHFGRERLAGDIAEAIAQLVGELSTTQAENMAPSLGASLQSMGRVGLRHRIAELIDSLAGKLGGESARELESRLRELVTADGRQRSPSSSEALSAAVKALEARLHLAAGLAYLGHLEQAAPIIDSAQKVLEKTSFRVPDHTLRLTRALTRALGQCPQEQALAGLHKLAGVLSKVTDLYNTNTHFCLSVIAFMECLVLGYARSDLALGEFGRRFLDEDEYLVRRRIHREIGETP